jgi:hypothetical protein
MSSEAFRVELGVETVCQVGNEDKQECTKGARYIVMAGN